MTEERKVHTDHPDAHVERSYDGDAFITHFAKRGARETIIMDANGHTLRSTVSPRRTYMYVSNLKPLVTMGHNVVRDLNPSNDMTFLRLRSDGGEVNITLGKDFILIVIQRIKRKSSLKTN
ncbi:dynein light chain roadblock-type 1 [Drosophila miranda]|uniref:dynein light chain roadblock-type 1 n=1 Tax=Drosophila miranda TaxID=7229 RepID=UPI00143FB734|nr:dynein light chain roadblock-type 1 [Drosophila miranda]